MKKVFLSAVLCALLLFCTSTVTLGWTVNITTVQDTDMQQYYPNQNTYTLPGIVVNDHSGFVKNSLLRFDLSSAKSSIITSATLYLTCSGAAAGGHTVQAFEVNKPWVQSQATWNVYATGQQWTSGGGDYGKPEGTATVTTSGTTYSFDVTNVIKRQFAGNNDGILLHSVTIGGTSHQVTFYSSDAATFQPYLVVTGQ